VVQELPAIAIQPRFSSDLAGANPMPSKLTQAARDNIELQLKAGTRVDIIANSFRIS
jgi:hypothetical protein